MRSRRVDDTPILQVTRDLAAAAEAPRAGVAHGGQTWFVAPGRADEPRRTFGDGDGTDTCGRCGSDDVRVVAFQSCVHPFSGDLYWDCEVVCVACGAHTAESFSENG